MTKKKAEKLDQILDKLDNHDKRFDGIDKRFDGIESGLNAQARKLLEHDSRFDLHERKFDEIKDTMLSHFDNVYGKFKGLSDEYYAIKSSLNRIEGNLIPRIEKNRRKSRIIAPGDAFHETCNLK